MKKIEKNYSTCDLISRLYEEDKVIFEESVLLSKDVEYSILYTSFLDIYDVVLVDLKDNKLINYEKRRKLSGSTLEYFNLEKNQIKNDKFGNEFKCVTHYIEYMDD